MRRVSADQALKLLQHAVKEKGTDYVDPRSNNGCVYFEESGAPACIVGHVFSYLGVSREDLLGPGVDWNYETAITGVGTLGDDGLTRQVDGVQFGADALKLLSAAQRVQDDGGTWGEALEEARVQAPQRLRLLWAGREGGDPVPSHLDLAAEQG